MFCKNGVKNNKETFTLAFIQSFFVLSAQKGNALILQEQKRLLLQLMHLSNSMLYFSRTKKKETMILYLHLMQNLRAARLPFTSRG